MASLLKFFPVKELGGEVEEVSSSTGSGELGKKGSKRLSVERIYQRKTQLEHILLRPDTYVGSTEESTEPIFVYDAEKEVIVKRNVTFVPGLYKIYDEILVNAADNKQRDPNMKTVKIVIDPEQNVISVWNGGRGIPIEMHASEKMYVPELIFGTLLTSSNYNDEERKVTGGRNGYGAKLCNIFSTEFTVETACKESGKTFKQTWKNNMGTTGKARITSSSSDYTKVSFKPDLAKFKMTHLDPDIVALMTRRAYDIAGCTKGVTVHLNGTKLPVKSFKDYVELYVKGDQSQTEEEVPRKVVYEAVNPRWEVAVTASNHGFQQASFVNSIATTKGGTHVNYIVDQVVSKLLEAAKKKNKGGMDLKPFHIKGHLWVFVNCLIENPTFDSQTKENMTLKVKSFGSTCTLSDKFIKQALSCGVVERVLSWARVKSQDKLAQKQKGSKQNKLRGIPKLDDANDAGSRNSHDCTLILTEGDSAKTLAVTGLGVVGRDHYGVFPLRGKLLNVREASHNQLMNNEEITNIVKILGLHYSKKYADSTELRSLRYGRLLIMTDQDQDGSHIKGLVINFLHHNWPGLIRHSFVQEFITPIVKVSKGHQEHSFYSLPEFDQWRSTTEGAHTWKTKYYKGLGTSTAKEAKEYFSDMERHRIPFRYSGPEDDDAILLAFSKKCIERRKEWLTQWLQQRRERRDQGLDESLLYSERIDHISYSEFVNKELILFSNMDNERSIACSVDGLKPGQRKVLFTCFKRNDKREIKVAQLAGSVGEHSAYHHGEQSLMSTIINLAQSFIGSNNINLLQPRGQFGTRLHGGKDAASPRYIFTLLSPLARLLFPVTDDPQLKFLKEENLRIEPEWYCPIMPMVLVNGCDGIGTGYSTFVPNYNPREIVNNLRRLMNGLEPMEMQPWYKNFSGTIAHVEPQRYIAYGKAGRLSPTSLEITELPVRTWTQVYKENVLEPMLHGTEKTQPFITDYKEYHTDTTVRFVVHLTADKMAEVERIGFHKKFKLETSLNTSNLVLFDHDGCLKKYTTVMEILQEFYKVRLDMYRKRKIYLEGMLSAESTKLDSQARFIVEKIDGTVVIENKRKAAIVKLLQSRGYPSDPVKKWKQSVSDEVEEEGEGEEGEEEGGGSKGEVDYNYLLSMSMWSLTLEKKEELLKKRDEKALELKVLQDKTPKGLWNEDLDSFMEQLDRVEEEERAEEAAGARITVRKRKGKGGKVAGRQAKLTGASDSGNSMKETQPSPFAEVVDPVIPEFCTERKKPVGRGRGKVKSEPQVEGKDTSEDDPKQTKLPVEVSKVKVEGKSKKTTSEKSGVAQAKKRKVTEMLESFEISSGEGEGEGEEEEIEKKSLRERIQLRKTKITDYTEAVCSGAESAGSEYDWKSRSDDEFGVDTAPIKKAKTAGGGGKSSEVPVEGGPKDPQPVLGEGTTMEESKKTDVAAKPKQPASKPAAKSRKVASLASSSTESSGEKKTVLGKKSRVVVHDLHSDEESDDDISSGSNSYAPPTKKKPATETAKSHPQSRQRKTATAKPTKPPASRAAAKPKKVAIVASSSTESSGEKQKKTVLGKKSRAAVHDIHSDEESVYSIHSASGSDIDEPPTKMAATETARSRPKRGQRVQYNLISDDSDDSDFMT